MKRYWKHAMAAATLAWVSGNAVAQPPATGLPATPSTYAESVPSVPPIPQVPAGPSEAPQSVTPAPMPPPTVKPAAKSSPTAATTQAPPLASGGKVVQENDDKYKPMPSKDNVDMYRFGSAKCEPPPSCCPPLCCPAANPVVCTNNAVPEFFDQHEAPQKWHWEIGGGVYYIQPNFHTNPAFLRTTGGFLASATQQTDFRYNMQVAPLGWIAYVSDSGLGLRGRYFQFDQGARESFTGDGTSTIRSVPTNAPTFGVVGGAPGDVLNFNSRLRVEVWDLEGTYTFSSCRWTFLAAAGVRYANLFQSYEATVTPGNAGTLPANASTVSSFNGAGPTFALESKYRFGESGLAVYGMARGSVLFGSARLTSGGTANVGDNLVIPTSFEAHQSDVLPIGEAEIGVEFGRNVGGFRVFAQTGFVGQVWFGGGNAASTNLGGHSFSNDTNFGFVGLAARVGVNF
jgi:Legionella pneumophila major outer membrane protein precursor